MDLRVGAYQFAPRFGDVEANAQTLLEALVRASEAGCDVLVAPELCLTGWHLSEELLRERLTDAVEQTAIPELAAECARRGVTLVFGAPIRRKGELFNCAVGIPPRGEVQITPKMHLFGAEQAWWRLGAGIGTVGVADRTAAMLVCYDAEFPEVARLARLTGADLLVVPTTNMVPYEVDQSVIFRARALENEWPVVVANRTGDEGEYRYFGGSLVLDARGRVVASGAADTELVVADVGVGRPDSALAYVDRRRPELYAPLASSTTGSSGEAVRGGATRCEAALQ